MVSTFIKTIVLLILIICYIITFKANITILPRTEDTGLFVHGFLENSLVSDSSNAGYRDFKYVQNKNKKSSHLGFTSEYPQTFGKYQISTEYQVDICFLYLILILNSKTIFNIKFDILILFLVYRRLFQV